jgi:hypothetical protein
VYENNKEIWVPEADDLADWNREELLGGLSKLGCERVPHALVAPATSSQGAKFCDFRFFGENDERFLEAKRWADHFEEELRESTGIKTPADVIDAGEAAVKAEAAKATAMTMAMASASASSSSSSSSSASSSSLSSSSSRVRIPCKPHNVASLGSRVQTESQAGRKRPLSSSVPGTSKRARSTDQQPTDQQPTDQQPTDRQLVMVEVHSGTAHVARAFHNEGYRTTTIDVKARRQQEWQAEDGHFQMDCYNWVYSPFLKQGTSFMWFSPDCSTFSLLGGCNGGKHRSKDNVEGWTPAAMQGNRMVEWCMNMAEKFWLQDENFVFCIENPSSLKGATAFDLPIIKAWIERRGLYLIEVTYCQFGRDEPYKPTFILTNSPAVNKALRGKLCHCDRNGIRHTCKQKQSGAHTSARDRKGGPATKQQNAAVPVELASLVAECVKGEREERERPW